MGVAQASIVSIGRRSVQGFDYDSSRILERPPTTSPAEGGNKAAGTASARSCRNQGGGPGSTQEILEVRSSISLNRRLA
jgi:hypothetical protein